MSPTTRGQKRINYKEGPSKRKKAKVDGSNVDVIQCNASRKPIAQLMLS